MNKRPFTPLPEKEIDALSARFEKLKIDLKELKQDHEDLKIQVGNFLQSTFIRICDKIEELEKRIKG